MLRGETPPPCKPVTQCSVRRRSSGISDCSAVIRTIPQHASHNRNEQKRARVGARQSSGSTRKDMAQSCPVGSFLRQVSRSEGAAAATPVRTLTALQHRHKNPSSQSIDPITRNAQVSSPCESLDRMSTQQVLVPIKQARTRSTARARPDKPVDGYLDIHQHGIGTSVRRGGRTARAKSARRPGSRRTSGETSALRGLARGHDQAGPAPGGGRRADHGVRGCGKRGRRVKSRALRVLTSRSGPASSRLTVADVKLPLACSVRVDMGGHPRKRETEKSTSAAAAATTTVVAAAAAAAAVSAATTTVTAATATTVATATPAAATCNRM